MKAVTAAEFDAIEQEALRRRSIDCLSVTTYRRPDGDPCRYESMTSYRHAIDLGPNEIIVVSPLLQSWPRVRSALVDGEHVVDAETLDAPRAARTLVDQYANLQRLRSG